MGFLHFLKDIDKYVFGGFFHQGVDGFKQMAHGHIGRAFGDFLGDMAEVVDPVIGTVGNAFTQSMMNGEGFENSLENAGIAAAGGLAGKAGGQAIDDLATRFGVDKSLSAVKQATGQYFRSFADTDVGKSIAKGFRNVGNRLASAGNRIESALQEPVDRDVQNVFQQAHDEHLAGLEGDELREAQRALSPDTLPTSTVRPTGATIRQPQRTSGRPEFEGPLRGTNLDASSSSFLSHMYEDPQRTEFEGDLRYDRGGPARMNRLRQAGQVGRSGLRMVGKGLRMTGRGVVGVGKRVYRSIPTMEELGQAAKEYPTREAVETALEDMKEQHFDMMHDGGSTGLGGDNPCPPGMVMRDGVCVPMK